MYCVRHCFLVAFVLSKARALCVEWANRSYNAAEDRLRIAEMAEEKSRIRMVAHAASGD